MLISIFIFYLFVKPIFFLLKKTQYLLFRKTNESTEKALKKMPRPIVFLIIVWFLKTMMPALMFNIHLNSFIYLIINIVTTSFWMYILLKLGAVVVSFYSEAVAASKNKLANQLIPVIQNSLSILVIFIGILKLLSLFGVDPITVVAGASIGGLALALASQDTVKNLIGTVMIFLDQPFKIGDYIENEKVEGWVENVGFRSTRVRAIDTSIYQVPNSTFSEMTINNKGMLIYRRYSTKLGIRYDTPPELIQAFVDGIKTIIHKSPDTRKDLYTVDFTSYEDFSLEILMNVYFLKINWVDGLSCRHRLNMSILNLATELGVGFAFPSSTIMIEQFPEKQAENMDYNTDKDRITGIIDQL
jgi:MscS family membrane protein